MNSEDIQPGQLYKCKVESFCFKVVDSSIFYDEEIDIENGDMFLTIETFKTEQWKCLHRDTLVIISGTLLQHHDWFERIL